MNVLVKYQMYDHKKRSDGLTVQEFCRSFSRPKCPNSTCVRCWTRWSISNVAVRPRRLQDMIQQSAKSLQIIFNLQAGRITKVREHVSGRGSG